MPEGAWVRAACVLAVLLAPGAIPARAESGLYGPLRIRDMTPFNLLRLDMIPAHAVAAGRGQWGIEADLSYSNTFVMSDNVKAYLEGRAERGPLSRADADAILALGEDAYYVDGEFGLLDLTLHYGVTRRSSAHLTLSAYDFTGGVLDGTIEGFHNAFGLENGGRDQVARGGFQGVVSLEDGRTSYLSAPISGGLGDPILGWRHARPLGASGWGLVLDGAVKLALRGERPFRSTGTNDYGLQASFQGKFGRQAVYLSGSLVSTDGRVLGVRVERRVVPTFTAAYEIALTSRTNVVAQIYASQSTVRDTSIEGIRANKYQASLGLRTRRGGLLYGFALTENLQNFENTPDIGVSLTLAWLSLRP